LNRLTDTNKWKDDWFVELPPSSKLIFMYLCENCDDAGFYKLNSKFMSNQLGMKDSKIVSILLEKNKDNTTLRKSLIFSNDSRKIWIKNFLFYQQQLPLERGNDEHKKIILILEKNLIHFDEVDEIHNVLSGISKSKGKRSAARFKKPNLKEFRDYGNKYAIEKNVEISEDFAELLYNHYESNGWKVGGRTPMKDWKAAMKNGINRELKKNKDGGIRTKKMVDANQQITNITVN